MAEPDKVIAIFRELVGEHASRLEAAHFPAEANEKIKAALCAAGASSADKLKNENIGFHLVDWQRDAAFIVALILFPEKFTKEEICSEIDKFMCHVPAHILEAARLGKYPVDNIFEVNEEATD
jgi:hypothetical protein